MGHGVALGARPFALVLNLFFKPYAAFLFGPDYFLVVFSSKIASVGQHLSDARLTTDFFGRVFFVLCLLSFLDCILSGLARIFHVFGDIRFFCQLLDNDQPSQQTSKEESSQLV